MYDSYKEEDPLYDNRRQESMDFIRLEIGDMIENSTSDSPIVDQVLYDININDVSQYLHQLIADQDFLYELTVLRDYYINDINEFAQVCDYVNVHGDIEFHPGSHRVFFIETSDFAVTIIPIKLDENTVNIHIEPLDTSPDLIRNMWRKTVTKKSIEDLKREGKLVKLADIKGGD